MKFTLITLNFLIIFTIIDGRAIRIKPRLRTSDVDVYPLTEDVVSELQTASAPKCENCADYGPVESASIECQTSYCYHCTTTLPQYFGYVKTEQPTSLWQLVVPVAAVITLVVIYPLLYLHIKKRRRRGNPEFLYIQLPSCRCTAKYEMINRT